MADETIMSVCVAETYLFPMPKPIKRGILRDFRSRQALSISERYQSAIVELLSAIGC